MAGATRISQAIEKALIVQQASHLWHLTQARQTVLLSVEPPPTFVRVQQTLEKALIEQAPPERDPALVSQVSQRVIHEQIDPAFSVGTRHQVLVSEIPTTALTGNINKTLIQELEPVFPAQVSQVRHLALTSTQPPMRGVPVTQVTQRALINTEAPITGTIVSQALNKAIVQIEAPSKSTRVSQAVHMALFVDGTTASKIRALSVTNSTLIQQEPASTDPERVKSVTYSVGKSIIKTNPLMIKSNAIVPAVAINSAQIKTFPQHVQSNTTVSNEVSLAAKVVHGLADPQTLMSSSSVLTNVVNVSKTTTKPNPSVIHSMSEAATTVLLASKAIIKAVPADMQSATLTLQTTVEHVQPIFFNSATIRSMNEVSTSSELVAKQALYANVVLSDSLVKKITRMTAKVAQYPNVNDVRSQSTILATVIEASVKKDTYIQPELIQATLSVSNVFITTVHNTVKADPTQERSLVTVRNEAMLIGKTSLFVDPTPIPPDLSFVRGIHNMIATRVEYFDPVAPENARRDSYGTYYVVLDN